MAGENSVTLVGNLVEDPELRFTPNGHAMAKVRLAVNRRWFDKSSNEWQEEASFFSGTCWAEMAEHVAESLEKGMRVVISGTLQQRTWENEQGERRSMIEVRIEEIAPSLKWATAQVTRTFRRDAGDYRSDRSDRSDGNRQPASVGGGRGGNYRRDDDAF